jgi:hypothetical protein
MGLFASYIPSSTIPAINKAMMMPTKDHMIGLSYLSMWRFSLGRINVMVSLQ